MKSLEKSSLFENYPAILSACVSPLKTAWVVFDLPYMGGTIFRMMVTSGKAFKKVCVCMRAQAHVATYMQAKARNKNNNNSNEFKHIAITCNKDIKIMSENNNLELHSAFFNHPLPNDALHNNKYAAYILEHDGCANFAKIIATPIESEISKITNKIDELEAKIKMRGAIGDDLYRIESYTLTLNILSSYIL